MTIDICRICKTSKLNIFGFCIKCSETERLLFQKARREELQEIITIEDVSHCYSEWLIRLYASQQTFQKAMREHKTSKEEEILRRIKLFGYSISEFSKPRNMTAQEELYATRHKPLDRGVSIGLGTKSKFTNNHQGKFGKPKDRTTNTQDKVINRGWINS